MTNMENDVDSQIKNKKIHLPRKQEKGEDMKIRTIVSGWKDVDTPEAIKFVNHLLNCITTMSRNEAIKYINTERLRGSQLKNCKETAKTINRLAREKMKLKLMNDIRIDLEVCKIEDIPIEEYLYELKEMIDYFIVKHELSRK